MVLFEKCRSRSIRKGHTTKISPIECPTRKRARSFATKPPPPPPSFLNILFPLLRYLISCELKWHVSLSPQLKRRASIPSSHSSRSSYAAMAHRTISVLFFLLCARWKSFFVLPVARRIKIPICATSAYFPPLSFPRTFDHCRIRRWRSIWRRRSTDGPSIGALSSLSLSLRGNRFPPPPQKKKPFSFSFYPFPLFPPPSSLQ